MVSVTNKEEIRSKQLTGIYRHLYFPSDARGLDQSKEINAFLACIMPPFSPAL